MCVCVCVCVCVFPKTTFPSWKSVVTSLFLRVAEGADSAVAVAFSFVVCLFVCDYLFTRHIVVVVYAVKTDG